jgi:two-component system, chemotaxis family, chemotaxis protein CheY
MTDRKQLHFLVVDDDAESVSMVTEYLKSMGYEHVSTAKDGAEATRALDADPTINFVISDWDMPYMNGLSLLQRVRASPVRANIPFLIMTSPISAEADKVIMAAESYVDGYVIKPFRSQVLRDKIDKMLQASVHGLQKQVVVVDDDKDARAMVVEYMKAFGFKDVHECENGKQALEHISQNHEKIGMIVSDWEMPELTGVELLRVCKTQKNLSEIPFLIITSQSSMERMKVMQAAKAQVDQYLLKPFKGDEIKKRIDALLLKQQSKREVQAHLTEANTHLEHGRYQRAQAAFEKILTLDATNEVALRGLGDIYSKIKGVEAALPFFKRAVEAAPMNAQNYLKLSASYEQVGLIDKAISLLQTANQSIGFNAELHFQLGKLYSKRGMVPLAKAEFEKTLEIQLDHQEARLMLEMMGFRRP